MAPSDDDNGAELQRRGAQGVGGLQPMMTLDAPVTLTTDFDVDARVTGDRPLDRQVFVKLGRSLLPPYLHPRKDLTFCLEPLVRVGLQHLLGELASHDPDNVLGLTGLDQVRDDRVPQASTEGDRS